MNDRDHFLFASTMSSIYHRRRATFLERTSMIMSLLTLLGGASGVISLIGDNPLVAQCAAGLVTFIGLIQIVYRPETAAAQHKGWLTRWRQMKSQVLLAEDPSADQLAAWAKEESAIETECVGEMRALQADAFNHAERTLALSPDHHYRLRWYHRAFCQIISFEHSFND